MRIFIKVCDLPIGRMASHSELELSPAKQAELIREAIKAFEKENYGLKVWSATVDLRVNLEWFFEVKEPENHNQQNDEGGNS